MGKKFTFIVAACCGVAGILVTWYVTYQIHDPGFCNGRVCRLFVPNLTGEDLANEDANFEAFLLKNGWEGEVGEDGALERS